MALGWRLISAGGSAIYGHGLFAFDLDPSLIAQELAIVPIEHLIRALVGLMIALVTAEPTPVHPRSRTWWRRHDHRLGRPNHDRLTGADHHYSGRVRAADRIG